ncbi:unnamed protein product [Heterosigma akashiwo]|mmetsp:Transcript_22794/g.39022  ORF Transcript_22794/g.39022 Transcript_22794/m.39022 type:complete len:81 (+) Transcript_22794:130-372(+)
MEKVLESQHCCLMMSWQKITTPLQCRQRCDQDFAFMYAKQMENTRRRKEELMVQLASSYFSYTREGRRKSSYYYFCCVRF